MDRILIKGHFAAQDSGAAGSKAGNALNVDRCQCRPYNKKRGTLRQAVGLVRLVYFINNRHFAEWRLLLFTVTVMVRPNT